MIAPNLKRRLSGVTSTIVRLVPIQARQIGIVAAGPGLPADIPKISLWRLPFLTRKVRRVWHARRNNEMLLGIVLRSILRRNLALLFTSASQRHHTGYTKWLISKMDAVIATSDKTAQYLRVPAKVILHGINTALFDLPENKSALRQELGLSDGLLVGCYGRIRHQKGTDVFVDALIKVMPEVPDMTGIVMGRATGKNDQYLDDLKAKAANAGLSDRLLFLPEVSVDQMADWYKILDLFVAPQRWEGFGLTPVEAMACGVPVIAGRVGAFEEQITEKTGQIIDQGDVDALGNAIVNATQDRDRLQKQGHAARLRVEQKFMIEDEAASIINVYRSLLAGRNSRSND